METRPQLGPNDSLISYLGCRDEDELRSCGYCNGLKPGNSDYLLWTSKLSPFQYQILMDRGWRRSGCLCYLPVASVSCCPAYTIRCDSSALRLSRKQKRVIKYLNEFLTSGVRPSDKRIETLCQAAPVNERMSVDDLPIKASTKYRLNLSASTSDKKPRSVPIENATTDTPLCKKSRDSGECTVEKGEGTSECNTVKDNNCQKAKYLRMQKSIEKLMRKTNCSFECAKEILRDRRNERAKLKGHKEKTLEERMSLGGALRHRITIKFVSPSADARYFNENALPVEHKVYVKYQCQIHKDPPESCGVKQFKRFLVDSTLRNEPFNSNCASIPAESSEITGYGSYHMQYWLDESTLLAVSVIDVTCFALSSVYFFYDPDYCFLNLGTLSALYELRQVRFLSQTIPDLKYYYMGYYIDTCRKMRYKKQFKPSYLLCPEAKTWHLIQEALPKLQISTYSRLNEDPSAQDVEACAPFDHGTIQVLGDTSCPFTFSEILSFIESENQRQKLIDVVTEYVSLVGCNFAKSVVFSPP